MENGVIYLMGCLYRLREGCLQDWVSIPVSIHRPVHVAGKQATTHCAVIPSPAAVWGKHLWSSLYPQASIPSPPTFPAPPSLLSWPLWTPSQGKPHSLTFPYSFLLLTKPTSIFWLNKVLADPYSFSLRPLKGFLVRILVTNPTPSLVNPFKAPHMSLH